MIALYYFNKKCVMLELQFACLDDVQYVCNMVLIFILYFMLLLDAFGCHGQIFLTSHHDLQLSSKEKYNCNVSFMLLIFSTYLTTFIHWVIKLKRYYNHIYHYSNKL
jgi:hypothetical protein